jgi:predicted DNA-binding transcriptional regulator YafY
MSRASRLLELMQALRRRRTPISGAALAEEMGVSLRTLYRDIATLQAQGASIEGSPGLGYVLRPGFLLPPLMLSTEEIEAVALGARWVAGATDEPLARAAGNAIAKLASVLPAELRHQLESNALLVGSSRAQRAGVDLARIRQAIREERKLRIDYRDAHGKKSVRIVWPFALGFFEQSRVIAAWCESRREFRHFRTDRIQHLALTDARYPRRRQALLKEWREQQGLGPGEF